MKLSFNAILYFENDLGDLIMQKHYMVYVCDFLVCKAYQVQVIIPHVHG